MRTIFITSFNPFISRNILSTDVLAVLKSDPDLRIVIFCPDYKIDFFKEEFASANILIEGVKTELGSQQDIVFSYLDRSLVRTRTLAIHRLEIFLRNKNIITFFFSYILVGLGRFRSVKRLVRWLDFLTINKNKFAFYFDKYQPDLVFVTDVFHIDDVHFLAEAKSRGLLTIGMVRSWDNITNKGLFRIKPNKLIVHNKVVKMEALKYEDMVAENVFVSGLPQFDYYFNFVPSPRSDFFERIGLDSNKKTIFFAPLGRRFRVLDKEIMAILERLSYQYIVRLPPNDTVDIPNLKNIENIFVDHPGFSFKPEVYRDREITEADSENLAEELFHSDFVVSYPSTVVVDAMVMNKPVVIIGFDGEKEQPYLNSARRILDFTHINKLLKLKCCFVAKNKEEFLDYMNRCLKGERSFGGDPIKLLQEQIGFWDGKSGARMANFIIDNIVG